ncbi:MAG TPA: hypothetical protein VKB93_14985 [Thermoanaerobaculia bacterium]|nr:hypothetical protein [Thermoanaerobaculia bacterium]
MTFDEFRAGMTPFGEVLRQQLEFLRDPAAADEVLRPGAISKYFWGEVWKSE